MSPVDPSEQFYQTPNTVEEEAQSAGVDLPLTKARRVAWNQAISSLLIFSMVMSLALYLVLQENPVKRISDKEKTKIEEAKALEESDTEEGSAEAEESEAPILAIQLYDGPYILDFLPHTSKKEGLSLFYIFNAESEEPRSDYFVVRKGVMKRTDTDLLERTGLNQRSVLKDAPNYVDEQDADVALSRNDVYLKVAVRHMEALRYEKAKVTLKRLLQNEFTHAQAQRLLLECLIQLEDYDEAISFFERLDELKVLSVEEQSDFGVILATTGRLHDAQKVLERACLLDRNALQPALNLAINSLVLQKWEQATEVLEGVLVQHPQQVDALGHLAYAHMGAKKYETARGVIERYLRLLPDSLEGRLMMAETYGLEEDISQAVLWLKLVRQQLSEAEFEEVIQRPAFGRIANKTRFKELLD